MIFVVLAIWLVGTWVTKFTLQEMALYTPIAVIALGALAGVILLWVKIVRESLRSRARRNTDVRVGHVGARTPACTERPEARAPSDGVRTVVSPCGTAPGRSNAATTPT